jgi:hypothetical protein
MDIKYGISFSQTKKQNKTYQSTIWYRITVERRVSKMISNCISKYQDKLGTCQICQRGLNKEGELENTYILQILSCGEEAGWPRHYLSLAARKASRLWYWELERSFLVVL